MAVSSGLVPTIAKLWQGISCDAGMQNSGFGRELGEWGLDTFMSVKQVTEYTSSERMDWYPEVPSKL